MPPCCDWPTSRAAWCCSKRRIASRPWRAPWRRWASARSPSAANSPSSSRRSRPSPRPPCPTGSRRAATARAASSRWCCIRSRAAPTTASKASACCACCWPNCRVKSAVRVAAEISGAPRNALYDAALRMREERERLKQPRPPGFALSRRARDTRRKMPSSLKAMRRGLCRYSCTRCRRLDVGRAAWRPPALRASARAVGLRERVAQAGDQLEQRQVGVGQDVADQMQIAGGIALQDPLEPVQELRDALLAKRLRRAQRRLALVLVVEAASTADGACRAPRPRRRRW